MSNFITHHHLSASTFLLLQLLTSTVTAIPATAIKSVSTAQASTDSVDYIRQNRIIAITCGTVGGIIVAATMIYVIYRFCISKCACGKRTSSNPVLQRSRTLQIFVNNTPASPDQGEVPFLTAMSPKPPSYEESQAGSPGSSPRFGGTGSGAASPYFETGRRLDYLDVRQ